MWGEGKMSIAIYGEVALDWLIAHNGEVSCRKGGAGLYAALSVARLGEKVELLSILSPEIDEYHISVWSDMGVSFRYAKNDINYSIPGYIVTGFENYRRKVSRPMTNIKYNYEYLPNIPKGSKAILVFPINHSIPKDICINASKNGKVVFLDPKPNKESIADAKEILNYVDVLLVNEEELMLLSSEDSIQKGIEVMLGEGPEYIIVKRGIKGCIIAKDNEEPIIIPSYKSQAVCTLGSGDVFGGALVATFLRTNDMKYSVRFASCMAACFIESLEAEQIPNKRAIEVYMDKKETIYYNSLKDTTVYLAGPFFSKQELDWVNYVHESIEGCGLKVLSPYKENGIIDEKLSLEGRRDIFHSDLDLILEADLVVALLDSNDPGTNFEIGYAYSNKKTIIGLKTSDNKLNNMIQFGCNVICNNIEDLIREVYKYAAK